eukprot:m.19599 g.19599  ORF g.19599 m.19599 type:complete len:222 (+) comp27867_c0_seq1:47-712(+)
MTDSELVVAAEYKVLVIGEFCTGKTSIVSRFIDNEFTFQTMTTIGIDFQSKVVTVDGVRVRLKVWDTAGQEKFRTITRMHFRGAQGIVLVYDITKRDSFENLQYWVERIQEERLRGESLVLLGNKSDLSSEREVSEEYAQSFSRELGIKQFQTSAKDNINITEAFTYLTERIKDYHGPHNYIEHLAPKRPSFYEETREGTLKLGISPQKNNKIRNKCTCKV